VKFLVDAQLPIALARWLSGKGLNARHVCDLGLDKSPDAEIWHRAKEEGRIIIITKDDDFRLLSDRLECIPPQAVWVRLGNCRKQALMSAF
jgi:predicted nuclease of predicted toxin-antitoxin system